MTAELRPGTSGTPDEIDLELLQLGAIEDPQVRDRIEAASHRELAPVAEELERYRAYFSRHAPGLGPPRTLWSGAARWVTPLLAAALLLFMVGVLFPFGTEGEFRAKGGLPVDVALLRDGVAVPTPWRFAMGDQVHVRFVAPVDGFVDVYTVQDDGAVSVLVRSEHVSAAQRFELPGAVRLDGHDGREWLVVELHEEGSAYAAILDAGRQLLPDPPAHATDRRWVQDVTRAP